MKYLICFLCLAVVIGTVLASGSDPDWYNGEIVMFDVYASSGSNDFLSSHKYISDISAHASVSAESGSDGWFSVWAEAGSDRRANNPNGDYKDSGSYLAGNNDFYASQYASSRISRDSPDWGYTFHSAHINSQDDEDWSPK